MARSAFPTSACSCRSRHHVVYRHELARFVGFFSPAPTIDVSLEMPVHISSKLGRVLIFGHTVSTFCRKSWPTFWLNSSSTMLCKHTDINIACSLHMDIHCNVSFAMRYSNDSSIVGFRALLLLLLLEPPSTDELDVVSSLYIEWTQAESLVIRWFELHAKKCIIYRVIGCNAPASHPCNLEIYVMAGVVGRIALYREFLIANAYVHYCVRLWIVNGCVAKFYGAVRW